MKKDSLIVKEGAGVLCSHHRSEPARLKKDKQFWLETSDVLQENIDRAKSKLKAWKQTVRTRLKRPPTPPPPPPSFDDDEEGPTIEEVD